MVVLTVTSPADTRYTDRTKFRAPRRVLLHQPLEQREHLHIEGVRSRIVLANLVVELRSLENQRDVARPRIVHQLAKGLDSDLTVAEQRMTILVRAHLSFAVIEMEE